MCLFGNGTLRCDLGDGGPCLQAPQLGALRHVLQITVSVKMKSIIKKESEISWRVWLMAALNGGVLLYCFSWTVLPRTPPLPPPLPPTPASSCGLGPAVYLTVHLREGLTEVKPMGGGGLGGTRGEGLAGCLCCAVAGRPSRDSARLRRGETRQGLRGGLMPCNED